MHKYQTTSRLYYIQESGLLYIVRVQRMGLTHWFVGSHPMRSICAYTMTYINCQGRPTLNTTEGATKLL